MTISKDKRRGERRDRSWRYARSAQRVHFRVVHPSGVLDCECERSVWRFAKAKSVGCRCRNRVKGAPKLPRGMCARGDDKYHQRVHVRINGNRLARAWLAAWRAYDPLDIDLWAKRARS